jgi:thioredoxin-related protein
MKKVFRLRWLQLFPVLPLIVLFLGASPKKKGLQWLDFDAGSSLAKKSKKPMLVDVYTDWCGWCKRMDKDTYSDQKIKKYLAQKYVLVKMNAESSDTVTYKGEKFTKEEIAEGFKVTGFPTVLFFEPNGDLITSLPGYLPPEKFIYVAKFIGDGIYHTMKWEDYEKTIKD